MLLVPALASWQRAAAAVGGGKGGGGVSRRPTRKPSRPSVAGFLPVLSQRSQASSLRRDVLRILIRSHLGLRPSNQLRPRVVAGLLSFTAGGCRSGQYASAETGRADIGRGRCHGKHTADVVAPARMKSALCRTYIHARVMLVGHHASGCNPTTHQYCLLTTVGGHRRSVSMYLEHHDSTRW